MVKFIHPIHIYVSNGFYIFTVQYEREMHGLGGWDYVWQKSVRIYADKIYNGYAYFRHYVSSTSMSCRMNLSSLCNSRCSLSYPLVRDEMYEYLRIVMSL